MKFVGLYVHPDKEAAQAFALQVLNWLEERNIRVWLDPDTADHLHRPEIMMDEAALSQMKLLITLGGDGTILMASRLVANHGVPILGVHLGQFGFVAEAHPGNLFSLLERAIAGQCEWEDRSMVQGEVWRNGEIVHSDRALNDVVINKGARSRMVRLQTALRGEDFASYPADGVIVSTPTGSTAYALSAGGPLVEPTIQALLLVPICPHALSARPLLLPHDERITITLSSDGQEVFFSADSACEFPLKSGDRIEIQVAPVATRLVVERHGSFYGKVRKRLLWGERVNA